MPSKNAKFCYLTPDFPKSGYAVLLFLLKNNQVNSILALNYVYNSAKEASVEIAQLAKDATLKKEATISEIAVLIPINFHTLYPLQKKFWQNPNKSDNLTDRSFAFLKLADNNRNFFLLVTPTKYDEKNQMWDFHATLPLHITASDEAIDQFMLNSDQVVDIKAKYAALYTCSKPVKFNWKTHEITPVDPPATEKHYSTN